MKFKFHSAAAISFVAGGKTGRAGMVCLLSHLEYKILTQDSIEFPPESLYFNFVLKLRFAMGTLHWP